RDLYPDTGRRGACAAGGGSDGRAGEGGARGRGIPGSGARAPGRAEDHECGDGRLVRSRRRHHRRGRSREESRCDRDVHSRAQRLGTPDSGQRRGGRPPRHHRARADRAGARRSARAAAGSSRSPVGKGKERPMKVRELMTGGLVCVTPETPVVEARQTMLTKQIRHLLVTEERRLLGIVTDRDIRLNLPSQATSLSVWEMNYLLSRLTVGEVMTKSVIIIGPDREARDAARLMMEHKIGALPVVDDDHLIGIVTETDILRAFAQGR